MKMNLKPIGIVHSPVKERTFLTRRKAMYFISEIEVLPEFRKGLKGINNYKELLVLFWFDRIKGNGRRTLLVHPKDKQRIAPRRLWGVFTSRSPERPNPIGITSVKLISCRNGILKVKGLDAIDNTPVIDIKVIK